MKGFIGTSAVLALLLFACGDDATGPTGPFTLTVTSQTRSAIIDLTDEQPYLCDYKAVAQSEGGEKGEYAEWIGGRLDWLVEDSVIFSFHLTAADLLDRLGDATIGRNKKQNFVRSASSTDPYDLRLLLSARHSSGEVLSDSSSILCEFPPDLMGPENLAGAWTATWLKWTSPDAIVWQYELTSAGGALSFVLSEDGSFSGSTTYPTLAWNLETQDVSGTLSIQDSKSITSGTITFDFAQGPFGSFSGTITRVKNMLYVDVEEGASFDFNRDGIPDPAAFKARFTLN